MRLTIKAFEAFKVRFYLQEVLVNTHIVYIYTMIGNKLYLEKTYTNYTITESLLICSEHHDQPGKMNTNISFTEVMRLDDINIGS